MLQQEYNYFIEHREELVTEHLGKFLVIEGNEIVGIFDNEADAYVNIIKNGKLGSVLLQQCLPGKEHYCQTFQSRVLF